MAWPNLWLDADEGLSNQSVWFDQSGYCTGRVMWPVSVVANIL